MPSHYIVQIIPLTAIRAKKSEMGFSYTSPKPVPMGSLVEISLGSRAVRGVAVVCRKSDSQNSGEIKPIQRVLIKSYVHSKQLELARCIAEKYFTPIGIVLKSFVPQNTTEREPFIFPKITQETITLTKAQKRVAKTLTTKTKKPALLFGPAGSGKTEVYIDLIRKNIANNKQSLVLFPEITLTPPAVEHYVRRLGSKDIVVLNSSLTGGQFSSAWERIRESKAKVILGSRVSLFAPFNTLDLIILDESQDPSYKQWDAAPRYDSRTVAKKLASLHTASLIFGSATPRLEEWRAAKSKNIRFKMLDKPEKQALKPRRRRIEIVNMRLEHWQKKQKRLEAPILSEPLLFGLKKSLEKKQQAILLINRQGMSAFSVCTRCKEVFRCPRCERALTGQRSGHFFCLHCHFRTKSFPSCPSCGNLAFLSKGLGTQKGAEVVQKEFPGARLFIADSSTMQKRAARQNLFEKLASREIDILIGTQMISKGWNLPYLSTIGVIDTDSLFSLPDWNTDERAMQLLFQSAGRVGRSISHSPGYVYIQTYEPEKPLFTHLKQENYAEFAEEELENRKSFGYPPFGSLVLLIGKHKDEKTLQKNARSLYKNLTEKYGESVQIFPPAKPQKHKIRDLYIRHIVIRLTNPLSSALRKDLIALPREWQVDVEPISII